MKKIFDGVLILIIIFLNFNIFKLNKDYKVLETKKNEVKIQTVYKDKIKYREQTEYEKLTIQNWIKIDIELQKIMPSCYNSKIGHQNNLVKNIQINELDFLKANSENLKNSFNEYGGFDKIENISIADKEKISSQLKVWGGLTEPKVFGMGGENAINKALQDEIKLTINYNLDDGGDDNLLNLYWQLGEYNIKHNLHVNNK